MTRPSTKLGAAFAALFILLNCKFAFSAEYPLPYFQFDSFTHSDTVPIKSAIDDWKGDEFRRGQRQWSYNWLEVGVRYKQFSLGRIVRTDYDLRFSKDLSELYWRTSNKQDFTPNETQAIYLRVNSFKGRGARFAFRHYHEQFHYQIGASVFNAYEFYSGTITGTAQTTSEKDYDFDLTLDYHYTEDRLFDRIVNEPDGRGYALDTSIAYRGKQHIASLTIQDIAARIKWTDAPYTTGVANSDRNTTDNDGFLVIRPTLSGFEGISPSFQQKLKSRKHFSYEYQFLAQWQLGLESRHQYGHSLQALSIHRLGTIDLKLNYWPRASITELTWTKSIFRIKLATDTRTLKNAESFWLSVGINSF
ncbi:MAG: hypothetical protein MI976_01970 [Pseudomonadales bacterium]|nr:hypothetical protein [Pseudomonadales bacterium]